MKYIIINGCNANEKTTGKDIDWANTTIRTYDDFDTVLDTIKDSCGIMAFRRTLVIRCNEDGTATVVLDFNRETDKPLTCRSEIELTDIRAVNAHDLALIKKAHNASLSRLDFSLLKA